MARLEIEFAVTGQEGVKKSVSDLSKAFDQTNSAFEKASANSLALEGDLVSLNKQFAAGTITGAQFAKEQIEITTALASSRQAAQGYQAQLNSLDATVKKGVTSLDNNGIAVKKLAGYHSDYTRGIRGASGVSLEFSRIIQDAPYGINGIGNNLQQLTANYQIYAKNVRDAAATQGKTISSFQIFKGALGGIISPLNLVTLGISVLTAGYTAYVNWSQKAAKADKEKAKAAQDAKQSLDEYTKSLNASIRAQVEGLTNSAKEITQLRILYDASRNLDLPLKERIRAAKALQEQYPKTFENFTDEQIALGKASTAYKQLATDIIATARAAARTDIIAENEKEIVQLEQKRKALEKQLKTQKEIDERAKQAAKETRITGGGVLGTTDATTDFERAAAQQTASKNIQQDIYNISKQITTKRHESLGIEKDINKELKTQQSVSSLIDDNKENKSGKAKKESINRAPSITNKAENSADLSGLSGVDKDVEQIRQKYAKMYSDLEDNAKKSADARKTYESDVLRIQASEATEITRIIVSEKAKTQSEIDRINATAGIKSAENIQKDLSIIDKRYSDEVDKAQGNAEILATIETAKQVEIEGVYNKYNQKRVDAQQKIFDKINEITQKGFTDNLNHTTKGSQKIDEQLEDRIQKLRKYFNDIRKLNVGDPSGLGGIGNIAINIAENAKIQQAKGEAEKAKSPELNAKETLTNIVDGFGTSVLSTFRGLSREADKTFSGIIGSIAESLGDELNNIFMGQFRQTLRDLISGVKLSVGELVRAGAGFLGSTISGITKPTSGVGQGIGGALTGAAAGAALGPVGAVVGGLVGLFSGIFGAKKRRKEEELQKQQLLEQQKQTKLLERQNALAYQSSIIGQQTNQGIVTGIERDATGNLVAIVTGKQIKFLYDQAAKDQKRGIM